MTAIHKSNIRKVALDLLTVDPDVQRVEGIDQRRVDGMAADFKPHALGVVTISERSNGRLVVLDGMHRCAAARQVGWSGMLTCDVFIGLTTADEAELFLYLNTGKMPSSISRFHARVKMDDPQAITITKILDNHGWRILNQKQPGCLSAIDALERVYRNGGGTVPDGEHPELCDRVIELLTTAWEHDSLAVHGHMLLAVAQLVGRLGASVDTKKLVSEMQATRPKVLVGKATVLRDVQGGTVPAALAKILVGMHNNRRRTNLLPEWVWIR